MLAASSSRWRRCCGLALMMALIRPWLTRAVERAPVETSANSSCTSRALTSRPLTLYCEPLSRSMRRVISRSSLSLNCAVALRCALSKNTDTSAMLRAGRSRVPPKMTSSMSPPRICLAEVSPMTQRNASTRLDLPQPLGPTTPVKPGWTTNSVASTKDLNPDSRSFVN